MSVAHRMPYKTFYTTRVIYSEEKFLQMFRHFGEPLYVFRWRNLDTVY